MNTENLSALFENGAYTLVVQKNGVTVHKDFGRGVGPALRVFDAQPELLKGALVCDTIVGKAAAAIYLLGGASAVYAETMSAAAADFLSSERQSALSYASSAFLRRIARSFFLASFFSFLALRAFSFFSRFAMNENSRPLYRLS